jgi:fatty acid desaturase
MDNSHIRPKISGAEVAPDKLRIDPSLLAEVRRLSKVSNTRGFLAIAWQWAVIALISGAWFLLPTDLGVWRWILYPIAVICIASRQHAILILMHEAAHYRLSKNRKLNDIASDIFCAFPLFISTELYRRRHLQHHQHTNTNKDPDWNAMMSHDDWHWPKDQIAAIWIFLKDVTGLALHKSFYSLLLWSPLKKFFIKRPLNFSSAEIFRFFAFYLMLLATLYAFNLWLGFFILWMVPSFSVLSFFVRYRTLAEHIMVESEHELNKTRHVDPTFFERIILAPLNVNYHLTHHLFPSVPFYNLPEMHRILMRHETFRSHAHLTTSYWGLREGVWAELTTNKAA